MTWAELLDEIEHRPGMYTGRPTYERTVFLVQGFDLAEGRNRLAVLEERVRRQYDSGPIAWPWVLLRQVIGGESSADLGPLTPEQDAAAIAFLVGNLRGLDSVEE
ncbi:MAG: hypothetical protein GC157_11420 [Frankiales bacterium]|nr:hypothetical protein [Frankiales bacterium]